MINQNVHDTSVMIFIVLLLIIIIVIIIIIIIIIIVVVVLAICVIRTKRIQITVHHYTKQTKIHQS